MKYKAIIGLERDELEVEFPWLKNSSFEDAIIEVTKSRDGSLNLKWLGGKWNFGQFFMGSWVKGMMWSNVDQDYIDVQQHCGQFVEHIDCR